MSTFSRSCSNSSTSYSEEWSTSGEFFSPYLTRSSRFCSTFDGHGSGHATVSSTFRSAYVTGYSTRSTSSCSRTRGSSFGLHGRSNVSFSDFSRNSHGSTTYWDSSSNRVTFFSSIPSSRRNVSSWSTGGTTVTAYFCRYKTTHGRSSSGSRASSRTSSAYSSSFSESGFGSVSSR